MPFKRYFADKDTTITNAYKLNLINRATDANMGASDSLEMFSIFGQANTSSIEKSRILIEFPTAGIVEDRGLFKIPASGSVKFFLRLFNVKHPFSVPRDYTASVAVVSQSWDEGYGLDMESYTDYGWMASSQKGSGATWTYATSGTVWNSEGATFLTSSGYIFNVPFSSGLEDIELDVTNVVEDWINGAIPNYGFIVKLSGSFEEGTNTRSFYTKKFSARGTEFFFKRPTIEARWESAVKDDRNNFFASSSILSADDNKMNLYFYNKVNGKLKNIVNNIVPGVKFYSNLLLTNEITPSYSASSNPATGIYKVVVSLDTTASVIYDKWINTSSLSTVFSSSFDVNQRNNYDYNTNPNYILNITNLKTAYGTNENVRFNIYAREKDWQPTIYTTAYNIIENSILPDLYYKIFRLSDNYIVVDYSTGSLAYTKTSYDSNGNYFEFDMNILEKGYVYGIKLARYDGIELNELANTFKFRVE